MPAVLMVSKNDATAIRAVYERDGKLGAAVELRCRFPGIADNTEARWCARTIAGWAPTPDLPPIVTRLRSRK